MVIILIIRDQREVVHLQSQMVAFESPQNVFSTNGKKVQIFNLHFYIWS